MIGPILKIGIALGSNLSERTTHLQAGRRMVALLHEGVAHPLCSGLYETEPVGCAEGTAAFLNAVMQIETSLEPAELLARLRAIEQSRGRHEAAPKNSPRELDLDLLYADQLELATSTLQLPHPRLPVRRFVLQPLADIRPDLVLPGQTETVAALLASLPAAPAVRLFAADW